MSFAMGAFDYFRTQIAALPDDVKKKIHLNPEVDAETAEADPPPFDESDEDDEKELSETKVNQPDSESDTDSEEEDLAPPPDHFRDIMFGDITALSLFHVLGHILKNEANFTSSFSIVYPYLNDLDSSIFNNESINFQGFKAQWRAFENEKEFVEAEQDRTIEHRIVGFGTFDTAHLEELYPTFVASLKCEYDVAISFDAIHRNYQEDDIQKVLVILTENSRMTDLKQQLSNFVRLSGIPWCFTGRFFQAHASEITGYLSSS